MLAKEADLTDGASTLGEAVERSTSNSEVAAKSRELFGPEGGHNAVDYRMGISLVMLPGRTTDVGIAMCIRSNPAIAVTYSL